MNALVVYLWSTLFRAIVVMLPALVLVTLPTVADDPPPRVLRVGYEEFRPYSFTDHGGAARGYSIDLISKLAADRGYDVEFIAASNPDELLAMLASGRIDVTSLLAITPARAEIATFTRRLGRFQTSLFVLAESPHRSAGELAGRRIGAVAGSFAVIAARTVPFAKIVEIETQEQLVLPLLSGSVEAVGSSSETFLALMRRLDLEHRITMITPPLMAKPRGFMVSPARPDVLADLNAAIATRIGTPELALLQIRWFGRKKGLFDNKYLVPLVLGGLGAILLVVAAILFAMRERRRRTDAFATNHNNAMLVDALNGFDIAVVIFDRKFRTVHWNDGMAKSFPLMVPHLRRGATLPELITLFYVSETVKDQMQLCDAEKLAQRIVTDISQGRDTTRIVTTSDGRTYEAFELLIGDGMIATVRKDVSRQENQAAEIRDQTEKLRAVNERLREFSSIAAHDLRGPLRQQGVLLDFVTEDLADRGISLPDDVTQNLCAVRQRVGAMSTLVEDLLDFARADHAAPVIEAFDPDPRIVDIIALAAPRPGIEIHADSGLPKLLVPRAAFDLVLRNLIANAIRHHDRPTGTIRLSATINNTFAVFEVEDDGPGIAPEARDKVFRPFLRLGSKVPGSGLGLSLVQRSVNAWGGEISIHGKSPRGAIFRFTAPLANPNGTKPVGDVVQISARRDTAA